MHSTQLNPFQPLIDAVDALAEVDPTSLSDREFIELVVEVERCRTLLAASKAKVIEEIARRTPSTDNCATPEIAPSPSSSPPHLMPSPTYERQESAGPGAPQYREAITASHPHDGGQEARGLERGDDEDPYRPHALS